MKIRNAEEKVLQPDLDHMWPGDVFERHSGRISLYNRSGSLQQFLDKNKKCKPPERTQDSNKSWFILDIALGLQRVFGALFDFLAGGTVNVGSEKREEGKALEHGL